MKKLLVAFAILLLSLLLCSSSLAASKEGFRVANGSLVSNPKKDWPFIVALVDRSTRQSFCTGSVIHRRWILTAAHCVEMNPSAAYPQNVMVLLSGKEVKSTENFLGISKIIRHPQFDYKRESCILFICWNTDFQNHVKHDVALLKLTVPVSQTSVAALAGSGAEKEFWNYRKDLSANTCFPICEEAKSGSLLVVDIAGYGLFCKDCQKAGVLRSGTTLLWSNRACEIYTEGAASRNIICTERRTLPGGKYQHGCKGDSGGPLTLQGYKNNRPVSGKRLVFGVYSFGSCGENRVGGYFHTAPYYRWITTQIKNN